MEWMFSTEIWIALLTLSTLEIVLGIDNLVFISIAVSKLPPAQRPAARRFGLALACVTRILLLLSLAFLASMQNNLFNLFGMDFSVRDLVLIAGGWLTMGQVLSLPLVAIGLALLWLSRRAPTLPVVPPPPAEAPDGAKA